jgi:hypothetical protein
MRPSGAISIAVGLVRPEICVSEKPAGKVAAVTLVVHSANPQRINSAAKTFGRNWWCIKALLVEDWFYLKWRNRAQLSGEGIIPFENYELIFKN